MVKIWTRIKYFTMKWRFRLTQSRDLFTILTFALLLAQEYQKQLPFFKNFYLENYWRSLALLSIILILGFVVIGYFYDKIFKLWSETNIINVERNPYTWVPGPKDEIQWLGWFAYLFNSIGQIAKKLDVELEGEELIKYHIHRYYSLNPNTPNFEKEALKMRTMSILLEKSFVNNVSVPELEEIIKQLNDHKRENEINGKVETEKEEDMKK